MKEGHNTVNTDTCDRPKQCVPLQKQDDNDDRLNISWSKIFKNLNRNLDTTHRERLVVFCVKLLLRLYLEGTKLTVQVDHQALKWILYLAEATGNLASCSF